MKFGILSFFINTSHHRERANGLEVYYVRKALIEAGHEVHVIGQKNRSNKDQDFYIDASLAEWKEYDGIFIQLSGANFFGGGIKSHMISCVEGISNAKVQIYNIVADPHLPPINPAKALERFNLCQEHVETWDNLIKDSIQLFPGKDIKQFNGWEGDPNKIIYFDFFKYMFKDLFQNKINSPNAALFEIENNKKWDVVYFGRNRKSYREQILQKYMPQDGNNILIGYKSKKINATQILPLKHTEMLNVIDESKVSIIIADEEHQGNTTTFRFYETLASNCLAAIPIEYDPNRELIKDTELRSILYVESQEDVKKLVSLYSEDLILKQKQELKRIFKEFNDTLKNKI